jgi:hypothetical protein
MKSYPLLAIVLLLAPACRNSDSSAHDAAPAASPATIVPEEPAHARASGAPLVFATPAGWRVEQPASAMRKAQFRVPRAEGDAKDAECVVYFFGTSGGGGVEANVERWCSQFEQPDGRRSQDVLVQSERRVSGMPVHEFELSGTYVAESAPGSGVRANEPGFRMLAAILESDHGAYYVKLVGPDLTVTRSRAAFRDLVSRVE